MERKNVVINISRNYQNGMIPFFDTKLPSQLNSLIPQKNFENTIQEINRIFYEAETLDGRLICCGFLNCFTGFVFSSWCSETTSYSKYVNSLDNYIASENHKIYQPKGLLLTSPFLHGLRFIQIVQTSPIGEI
eukprot:Sdes_comp15423_c0_seq1m4317